MVRSMWRFLVLVSMVSVPWAGQAAPASVVQQAYLKASNTGMVDFFGSSVAVSGDTVAIGATGEDSGVSDPIDLGHEVASASGAVYVFVHEEGAWRQQAFLKASNADARDVFGGSVALSGDTLVVGASQEDSRARGVNGDASDDSAPNSGAVYVFVRRDGSWIQEAYLKASNAEAGDRFGNHVAISGDTIVVGAWQEDSRATGANGDEADNGARGAGAAYVFVREGTTWRQEAYLKASNTEELDHFGIEVALSGDTVVVGATWEDSSATGVNGDESDNSLRETGAAYVFARTGTTWNQQAYLKASNTGADDYFGKPISVSGDTVVVGVSGEDSDGTGVNGNQNENSLNSGAAYVFVREGTQWSQEAFIKASNAEYGDGFGTAVAIDGDALLVTAAGEDSAAVGVGGDQEDDSAITAGAAYLFLRSGTSWAQEAYIKASNTGAVDWFGEYAGLADGVAVFAATLEDGAGQGVNPPDVEYLRDSGAAYVFRIETVAAGFRTGGRNPASYVASPVRIGETFTASVDNRLAGQRTSRLFAFEAPGSLALSGDRVLLGLDLGRGELFTGGGLAPASSVGGVDRYHVAVPNEPALRGVVLHSQAIQLGEGPFVLSNAQDLTIGS